MTPPPTLGGGAGPKHAEMRLQLDAQGDLAPSFAQVGTPSTSPASVTTASTTTATGGLVLASSATANLTVTGTATPLTLQLNRDGSSVTNATASATTVSLSVSNVITAGDPTWTISATIGTARDISSLGMTVSRESRW